ncbi:hypothetical protein ACFWGL_19175 [Streptomyces sp. NPDC060286]|uniref:hypothetical protein n=1 Tax=unclassified Streptomyces TaxID=2593676 RepID=UPI0035DBDDC2
MGARVDGREHGQLDTEEMLLGFGGRVWADGTRVMVEPGPLSATDVAVPGDPSQAAFWAVAALLAEGGSVVVEDLYTGFGRSDYVDVLRRMGAAIEFDAATGTLTVRSSRLRAVELTAADIPGIVDEVPVLAIAAAVEEGTTVIEGGAKLRSGTVDSHGDHRLAMAAAVAAACAAEGETLITGWDSVATSYPAFMEDVVRLTGADVAAAADEV